MSESMGKQGAVRGTVAFTAGEISQIQTFKDAGDYPGAYDYISGLLNSTAYGGVIDEDTKFWFAQAGDINRGTGNSSLFIRAYTSLGILLSGEQVGDLVSVSDDIAIAVLDEILSAGGMPDLPMLLAKDISKALNIGNVESLAG